MRSRLEKGENYFSMDEIQHHAYIAAPEVG
jgi:hypothetical protein